MKMTESTILITGANRGIGRSLVDEALERGAAKVYATYRAEANRADLEGIDPRVIPIQLDLSDKASIARLGETVSSLNVLINNAGIFTGTDLLGDTEDQARADIETNFFGTLGVTKALLPALREGGSAAIVNVSSIAALASMPGFGGYSAAKAAVHSMTQSIRGKLKPEGIAVHGVYPGPVATRLTDGFEMDTTPASVVATSILVGVEEGTEDIFPDAMSRQTGPLFMSNPKQLEKTFSEF